MGRQQGGNRWEGSREATRDMPKHAPVDDAIAVGVHEVKLRHGHAAGCLQMASPEVGRQLDQHGGRGCATYTIVVKLDS